MRLEKSKFRFWLLGKNKSVVGNTDPNLENPLEAFLKETRNNIQSVISRRDYMILIPEVRESCYELKNPAWVKQFLYALDIKYQEGVRELTAKDSLSLLKEMKNF
jgi:hypothetical protein